MRDGQRPRGARPHDGGRGHGRHRVPEGPRRDPRAVAPGRRLYDTHHGMTNAVFMPYVLGSTGRHRGRGSPGWRPTGPAQADLRRLPRLGARPARGVGVPHTLAGLRVDDARSTSSRTWRSWTPPPAAIRWRGCAATGAIFRQRLPRRGLPPAPVAHVSMQHGGPGFRIAWGVRRRGRVRSDDGAAHGDNWSTHERGQAMKTPTPSRR